MAQNKRALRTGQVEMAEFLLSAYGNEDPIDKADSIPFPTIITAFPALATYLPSVMNR